MRIIIEDAPEDLALEIAALIGRHASHESVTLNADWTVPRAEMLLRDLPTTAGRLIREAVLGDGWAAAERLRGADGSGSLRGRSGAITKAITRGTVAGRWPDGMPSPVQAQYDPDVPSYQRTVGYRMADDLVTVFRAAMDRIDRKV
ncbi:hypothetical protein [Streptomyces sp. NPDC057694]|uniref:hypothetical protein n=1 Tax=Streptomyces sp. NPDC057694 TaxID=3346216 RepID=UPI00367DE5B1